MIALEPFTETDITIEYLSWLNDKHHMRYSSQRFNTHTRETSLAYLKTFEGTPNKFWSLWHGDRRVGTANAYIEGSKADVGLLIGYPGNGYGFDAWKTIFKQLASEGISVVTAGTAKGNTAMQRIMEKSGMQLTHQDQEFVYYQIALQNVTSETNQVS